MNIEENYFKWHEKINRFNQNLERKNLVNNYEILNMRCHLRKIHIIKFKNCSKRKKNFRNSTHQYLQ